VAPALQNRRLDLASAMKAQAGSLTSGGLHVLVRKALVVAQVMLSLLLLAGAGLFLRSLDNLRRVDLGFRPDHLIEFSIDPQLAGPNLVRVAAMMTSLQDRLASIPGVTAAASSQRTLLTGSTWASGIYIPGYQTKEGENAPNVNAVGAGYFKAMGIPLVAGRDFRTSDDAAAPHVALVNQTFAEYYFGAQNPIGRQFYLSRDRKTPIEVVGVARDGKYTDVRESKLRLFFYPYVQHLDAGMGGMTYYLRSALDTTQVMRAAREIVRETDPALPIFGVKTVDQQIDENLFADRIVSALSTVFAVLATVLAAIGLYGVLSYSVTRRTREIGIRMALGASRREVLLTIQREVLAMTALGIALAIPLYYLLAGFAGAMLYSVAPHDVWMPIGAAAVLAVAALVAGYVPAARAAGVDPLVALRVD
jgi:predicted permease